MPEQNQTQCEIEVLIIDNMDGQAKFLQSELEKGGLKVTSLLLSIQTKVIGVKQIPSSDINKVVSFVKKKKPMIVLVDICLDETLFDTPEENRATWTGPAIMSEIRKNFPNQIMASYSAYSRYVKSIDQDIQNQRVQYSVADTPHWSVHEITVDRIKSALP